MYLRRMAEIARDAQNNAPRDPLAPPAVTIPSSYMQALDTVHAHVSSCIGIYGVLICTTLGPTRGDVPGHCGVVAKASRRTDALKSDDLEVVCRVLVLCL